MYLFDSYVRVCARASVPCGREENGKEVGEREEKKRMGREGKGGANRGRGGGGGKEPHI